MRREEQDGSAPEVRDPVCGRILRAPSAAPATRFGRTRYLFCSRLCQTVFEAFPATYAAGSAAGSGSGDEEGQDG